jgi:LuxR family maltose regulon positive regulatory protein
VDRKSGQASPEFIEQLNERELEGLQLFADGLARRAIATHLIISLNTVKTHARNIFSKVGVHNQPQPVGKAQGLGLLEKQ